MLKTHYLLSLELLRDKIKDEGQYPFNLTAIQQLNKIEFHEKVTFLIGENGSGKSTIMEAIATGYGFNPEGGSKNFNFSTKATHSKLGSYLRLAKGITKPKDGYFLRAESFYNLASNIDDLDEESGQILSYYGDQSLHHQSHGESFFSIFLHRLFGNGLYILDEPEAALSPQRQLAFLTRMDELIRQNSQFIIATHSPIILSYPHAKIIQISANGLDEVAYKDTDHYNLYKDFLVNPEYMLKKLDIS